MTHVRKWLALVLGILLLVVLVPLAAAQMTPSVEVSDQTIENDTVVVAKVVSNGPGWIVIHADNNGSPGQVLGHAPVADGENTNVVVDIAQEGRTEKLWAMLHADTGTVGTYEFPGGDPPVTVDGNIVMASFQATAMAQAAQATVTPEMTQTPATPEATQAAATPEMAATPTPQPQALPQTGGGPTAWPGILLLGLGGLILIAGVGLASARR
jgi:hypothetical protein